MSGLAFVIGLLFGVCVALGKDTTMKTNYPTIRVKLDEGAYLPERAHDTDAGADIRTPTDVTVGAHDSAIIRTGVHVETPHECMAQLLPKSGLNVKHDILSFGVIDEGYDGEIVVKLYNLGDVAHRFERGDAVSQLVVQQVCYPTYEQADEISAGERGSNGFGSTDRRPRP